MVITVRSIQATSLILLLGLVFVSSANAQNSTQSMPLFKHAVPEVTLKQYPVLPYKFTDLIKALPKSLPTTLDQVQKLANNKLYITEKDGSLIAYAQGPFRTLDGVVIKEIGGLVDDKNYSKVMNFGMYLDLKQCVNSKLLKREFGFSISGLESSDPIPDALVYIYVPDERRQFLIEEYLDYPDCTIGIGSMAFTSKNDKKEWIERVREFKDKKNKVH